MTRSKRVPVYCACSSLLGLTVLIFSRQTNWFGEWYASHIFPLFPNTAGRAMSLVPFSVFEMSLCALALIFAANIIYRLVRFTRRPMMNSCKTFPDFTFDGSRYNFLSFDAVTDRRVRLKNAAFKMVGRVLVLVCSAFMLLSLTCLVNYERAAFMELTGRETITPSKERLLALCELIIEDIEALEGEITTDGEGVFTVAGVDAGQEAKASMKRVGQEVKELAGYYPNPKPVFFSKQMSMLGLTGIYSPFTVEANYNRDIPEYLIPYTICHELAHLKGFIREDEAGFIAYIACRGSETAEFQYSGAANALSYALRAYAGEASPEEYAAVREKIPEQALRDLSANNEYWRQFRGKAYELARRANDNYLKANAQADGVESYGRMADLLLSEYKLAVDSKI